MNLLFRNIVSLGLLSFYVASGALIELTHHDAVIFSTQSRPTFEQHDCDAHEKHVSPEASHCLACTHANHRVATEAQSYLPLQPVCVAHGRILTTAEQTLEHDFYHSGKRGPPSRIA